MNTVVSANSSPTVAEELFRAAWTIYNDLQELDPKKDSEILKEFAQCGSTEDIMFALKKQMTGLKDFRDDRWAKLRAKLEPVVVVVLRVTTIVGRSSIVIPGGNFVFAAVGLLLTATQAQSKKCDTLEELLGQLSAFLDRFTVLYDDTLSKRRPGLDQIVTKTLAHLLYVLALSTKFIRKSRLRHYSRALFGIPDDLQEALRKFNELLKDEERMTIAYIQLTAEQIDKNIEYIAKVQVDDHIKKWLSASDPSTDWNTALGKRQEGTGDWFLRTEAFEKWKSSGGEPILWLHGQSGSGKTIISARVIEELLDVIPDLAYFFIVKAKESLDSMLSSILVQLVSVQDRSKILVEAYNLDKDKGNPSLSSLHKYFEKMLAVPCDVFLIIHGLDEHPAPHDMLLDR